MTSRAATAIERGSICLPANNHDHKGVQPGNKAFLYLTFFTGCCVRASIRRDFLVSYQNSRESSKPVCRKKICAHLPRTRLARRDEQHAPRRAATCSGVSSSSSRVRALISALLPAGSSCTRVHSRPCTKITAGRAAPPRAILAPVILTGVAGGVAALHQPQQAVRAPGRDGLADALLGEHLSRVAAARPLLLGRGRRERVPCRRRPRRRRACRQLRVSHVFATTI